MKKNNTKIGLKLIWLVFFVGICYCGDDTPQPGEIVARVGDTYLTRDIVLMLTPKKLNEEDRALFIKRLVDQWIDNQTLAFKAGDDGLKLTVGDKWHLTKLETDMLVAKYLNKMMTSSFEVTQQKIEEYYDAHQEEFKRAKDEVHLVHLFFEKLDKAIVKEIKKSKSLPQVIKNNSYLDRQINNIVEPNGDLGFVVKDQLRREFQKAIRGVKIGLIYGPIRTTEGYHYLQILDRKPAGSIRSLELVHQKIESYLLITKRHETIKKLKEKIRKEFLVETFYDNAL